MKVAEEIEGVINATNDTSPDNNILSPETLIKALQCDAISRVYKLDEKNGRCRWSFACRF